MADEMRGEKLGGRKVKVTTQQYLDIAEIRDDIVVLKDGSLRAVLLVSSINFALKSEDEQNASVSAYISFLNSFEFPIQIVVQSRKLNIDEYIARLKKVEKEQTNELLKIQTTEYRNYIQELVQLGDIMSKRFYVIVPFNPAIGSKGKGFFSQLSSVLQPAKVLRLSKAKLAERKKELMSRVDLVTTGLFSVGLNVAMLNTASLIELYYSTYNPRISEFERMSDVSKLRVEK